MIVVEPSTDSARERVVGAFEPPLRSRVEALGSTLTGVAYVALEDESGESALAEALGRVAYEGAGLILLAGETAIVDRHDIAPRALERAGGEVVAFGAPVDPGNLLLLGYLGPVPVLGAPGCARSPKPNVVDKVLPRLLAGDRLDRNDLALLGQRKHHPEDRGLSRVVAVRGDRRLDGPAGTRVRTPLVARQHPAGRAGRSVNRR